MKFMFNVSLKDAVRTGLEPGSASLEIALADLTQEERQLLMDCSERVSDNVRRLKGAAIQAKYWSDDFSVPFEVPDVISREAVLRECVRCRMLLQPKKAALLKKAEENIAYLNSLPANPAHARGVGYEITQRLTSVIDEEADALQAYIDRCAAAAIEDARSTAEAIRKIGHLPLKEVVGSEGRQVAAHAAWALRRALGDDYDRLYAEAEKRAVEVNADLERRNEKRKEEAHARKLEWLRDRGEDLLADKIEEGFSCGAAVRDVAYMQAATSIYLAVPSKGSINPSSKWDGNDEVRNPSNAVFVKYQELRRRGVSCSIGLSTRIREGSEDQEDTDPGRQEVIFCYFPCPWDPEGDKEYTCLVVSSPTFRTNV